MVEASGVPHAQNGRKEGMKFGVARHVYAGGIQRRILSQRKMVGVCKVASVGWW